MRPESSWMLLIILILSACSAPGAIPAEQALPTATTTPGMINERIDDPQEYSYRQLLAYDAIRPVYQPEFASAAEAGALLQEDELVLGLSIEGEAKAYPISVLHFREMVNDELGRTPVLVTW